MRKKQESLLGTAVTPTPKLCCMWNKSYARKSSSSSCLTTTVEVEILCVKLQGFLTVSFNVCFCLKEHTSGEFTKKKKKIPNQPSQQTKNQTKQNKTKQKKKS